MSLRDGRSGGRLDQVTRSRSRGVGIRVLGPRTWGFACTASLDEADVVAAALRAVTIAVASSARSRRQVAFPGGDAVRGVYRTPLRIDPFTIAIEQKLEALARPLGLLLSGDVPALRAAEARMEWQKLHKRLVTTEGTDVTQDFVYGACGMQVTAVDDAGHAESRTYPTFSGADSFQGGYEKIAELDLEGAAPRIRDEALALLRAPPCPAGEVDVILESSQVALQVHESCGHPTELDRALGTEITLAGGSFLAPSMLGTFRYGSPMVTLTCDAVTEGGLGTFGWDDEATPAGRHQLVHEGIFTDYLSSREMATLLGRTSTGTMRASGWDRTPLIRMTNVSLAPGQGSLEGLIADTKDGIFVATDRSWSIDDQRLDFHFSCELAWEIKNGKRTRLLRNPIYSGSTPRFWASCDAICGSDEWKMWGVATCGKGDPIQMIGVGHGAAPARFRGVKVGSAS